VTGIVRVDLSVDEGLSWTSASLEEGGEQPLHRAWAWTLFECEVPPEQLQRAARLARDRHHRPPLRIISKATDASYNVQPESLKHVWNLRGINNNACHHVEVQLSKEDAAALE
jgi:sulfite oxidase